MKAFPWRGLMAGMVGCCLSVAPGRMNAEWPQWLGPTRDGVVPGTPIQPWAESGPEVQWRVEVGNGFSSPVVVADKVLLHHRRASEEILEAFDRDTGKSLWKAIQPTAYSDDFGFDDGPRGTPAVANGMAYAFGAEGRLTAVAIADGRTAWTLHLGRELDAGKGFFGFGCSPLVVSNRVIVQVGGRPGAGIVAVEERTGALAWKATDDEAGYASPVVVGLGGRPRLACLTRAGLRILEVTDGRMLGFLPWRSRQHASVNAATPIACAEGVLVTSSYGTGAALVRWGRGGELETTWSGDDAISAHISTPVRSGDLVFGFHGRQEQGAVLRCIEAATGRVRWESSALGIGSVLRTGNRLLVLLESGELLLGPANGSGWRVESRGQILGSGVRAVPAIDGRQLFARDRGRLVSVRIR